MPPSLFSNLFRGCPFWMAFFLLDVAGLLYPRSSLFLFWSPSNQIPFPLLRTPPLEYCDSLQRTFWNSRISGFASYEFPSSDFLWSSLDSGKAWVKTSGWGPFCIYFSDYPFSAASFTAFFVSVALSLRDAGRLLYFFSFQVFPVESTQGKIDHAGFLPLAMLTRLWLFSSALLGNNGFFSNILSWYGRLSKEHSPISLIPSFVLPFLGLYRDVSSGSHPLSLTSKYVRLLRSWLLFLWPPYLFLGFDDVARFVSRV